jgi:hypothetical protein
MIYPPALVIFTTKGNCPAAQSLFHIQEDIINEMNKIYPVFRVHTINYPGFDEYKSPSYLCGYTRWIPALILVPGPVSHQAMQHLGPNNPIIIYEGVQIFNGKWSSEYFPITIINPKDLVSKEHDGCEGYDHPVFKKKYDPSSPLSYVRWFSKALDNKNFKQVQGLL